MVDTPGDPNANLEFGFLSSLVSIHFPSHKPGIYINAQFDVATNPSVTFSGGDATIVTIDRSVTNNFATQLFAVNFNKWKIGESSVTVSCPTGPNRDNGLPTWHMTLPGKNHVADNIRDWPLGTSFPTAHGGFNYPKNSSQTGPIPIQWTVIWDSDEQDPPTWNLSFYPTQLAYANPNLYNNYATFLASFNGTGSPPPDPFDFGNWTNAPYPAAGWVQDATSPPSGLIPGLFFQVFDGHLTKTKVFGNPNSIWPVATGSKDLLTQGMRVVTDGKYGNFKTPAQVLKDNIRTQCFPITKMQKFSGDVSNPFPNARTYNSDTYTLAPWWNKRDEQTQSNPGVLMEGCTWDGWKPYFEFVFQLQSPTGFAVPYTNDVWEFDSPHVGNTLF